MIRDLTRRCRTPRARVGALLAAACAASFFVNQPLASAANRTWTNSAGGVFGSSANWGGQSVPGASDLAIFNLASNYTVNFDLSPTNDRLLFDDGQVTFNLSGGRTYTLNSAGSASMIVGAGLFTDPDAVLTLTGGGTLSAAQVSVGNDSRLHGVGLGQVNVSTSASWNVSGVMSIGDNVRGIVNVSNGGDVRGNVTEIGLSSVGTATVIGAGST